MLTVQLDLQINSSKIAQIYIRDFLVKSGRILDMDRLKLSLVKTEALLTDHDIAEGKEIELSICYQGRYPLTNVFKGFITEVHREKQWLDIEAEDYSYLLKPHINQTFKELYDADIIEQITGGKVQLAKIESRKYYPKISFEDMSIRKALRYLANNSNSDCFFRGNQLYYGEKFQLLEQTILPVIDLNHPAIVSRSNLKWHDENKEVQVFAVARDKKGDVHTGKKGKGAIFHKLKLDGMNAEETQTKAEERYKQLIKSGYRGSIKLLAEPFIWHSGLVKIMDQRTSNNYVDAVHYSFSPSAGLRMELFMGQSADDYTAFIKSKKRGTCLMKENQSDLGYVKKGKL